MPRLARVVCNCARPRPVIGLAPALVKDNRTETKAGNGEWRSPSASSASVSLVATWPSSPRPHRTTRFAGAPFTTLLSAPEAAPQAFALSSDRPEMCTPCFGIPPWNSILALPAWIGLGSIGLILGWLGDTRRRSITSSRMRAAVWVPARAPNYASLPAASFADC